MATLMDDLLVPTKLVMLGIFVGAISGLVVAEFDPGPTMAAVVDKAPFTQGKALDTHLLHEDGRYFAIGSTPDVSLDPLSTSVVRKIGYGRTNFVTIATTSTGVYSSEGLTSVHTAYAGPYVTPPRLATPTDEAVYGWSKLTGWTKIPVLDAQSFSFLDAIKTDTGRGGECAAAATGGLCL